MSHRPAPPRPPGMAMARLPGIPSKVGAGVTRQPPRQPRPPPQVPKGRWREPPPSGGVAKEELAEEEEVVDEEWAGGVEEAGLPPAKRRRLVGLVGEVRYALPGNARDAIERLDGSVIGDSVITIMNDVSSHDGTKLVVYGLPIGVQWQQLKDHFAQCGLVNFANLGGGAKQAEMDPRAAGGKARGREPRTLIASNVKVECASDLMIGEVRFDVPELAQQAIDELNGSLVQNNRIAVEPDPASVDGTKLVVHGLPIGIEWQELKDHFASVGPVAFANVRPRAAPRQSTTEGGIAPEPGTGIGEVRYDSAADTRQAVTMLNGTVLQGFRIRLQLDQTSKDGTKLIAYGIAPGVEWQEMKDHFSQVGVVAYANVTTRGSGPALGGKGGMKGVGKRGLPVVGRGPGMMMVPPQPSPVQFAAPPQRMGEVRFADLDDTMRAVQELNGSILGGVPIHIQIDTTSKDRSKCIVYGLPHGIEWQELKDHFSKIGPVAFANVTTLATMSPAQAAQWRQLPMGVHTPAPPVGEVRYDSPEHAEQAIEQLNGADILGCTLSVEKAPMSHDGAKLLVRNVPPSFKWQELKDVFAQIGRVAFVEIRR